MRYRKNEKFLEKLFGLAHNDIGGELFDSNGGIDIKKFNIVSKTFNDVVGNDREFYMAQFFKNYNIEGDYTNIVIIDTLTLNDFIYNGIDKAFIISKELNIPIESIEDDEYGTFCIKEDYEEYGYSGCYRVYTEEHGKEILDDFFMDNLGSFEELLEDYSFDVILKYIYISKTDKRLLKNDMVENELSNIDEDEMIEMLGNFKVGEHLSLIEKYYELKEEIEEKEFEGESVDELEVELGNILFDVEDELRNQMGKYYSDYLDENLEDFLWDFGYIYKDKSGEFKIEGDKLPTFIAFDENSFVKNENDYSVEFLSPYGEVYETYQFGKWYYISRDE